MSVPNTRTAANIAATEMKVDAPNTGLERSVNVENVVMMAPFILNPSLEKTPIYVAPNVSAMILIDCYLVKKRKT